MIGKLDGGVPVSRPSRLSDLVLDATSEERLFAVLLATMAALAGFLASIGLYGVITYVVAQRRLEFGIRLALGADAQRLVGDVIRRAALLAVSGILLGWIGAAGFARTDPVGLGVSGMCRRWFRHCKRRKLSFRQKTTSQGHHPGTCPVERQRYRLPRGLL